MSKFKVGDMVKVIREDSQYSNYKEFIKKYGNINKWVDNKSIENGTIAKIVNIKKHLLFNDRLLAIIENNNKQYIFNIDGLELVKEQETIDYQNKKYDVAIIEKNYNSPFVGKDCLRLTLKEHKEEILDEKEKEYLRNVIKYVIKPTHNEVDKIFKCIYGNSYYIRIFLKNGEHLLLPNFNDTRMYKMMKLDETYTLEQLNLEK